METSTIALLVLIPLLVWRIYSRLKRMMGRQPSHLWRHWTAATLLPLLIVALGLACMSDALALSCLGAGSLAGAWSGMLALKLTRFESTAKGFFFTPNRHLGMVVALLFIARILYRGLELYVNSHALTPMPESMRDFTQSPLSVLVFGLLAAYHCSYGYGLLRWRKNHAAAKQNASL